MKQAMLSLVFVFSILSVGVTGMAIAAPTPVPQITAEMAGVGESGPAFNTGSEELSTTDFVNMVVQDVNTTWGNVFESWGYSYVPPTVVTVGAGAYARSGCGINSGNPSEDEWLSPALYCRYGGELGTQLLGPNEIFDTRVTYEPVIYLSIQWLEQRIAMDAPNADFAVAYVVTYEFSYHVQNLLGYTDHTGGGYGELSDMQIEMTAECLTGVWAYSAYDTGYLAEADVQAAQDVAWGDDAMMPDQFGLEGDHGTSDERLMAFMSGYASGNPADCFASLSAG